MRLEVPQPVLDFDDMARLRHIEKHTGGKFKSYELDITYPLAWGDEGVEAKLASLCAEAVDAITLRPQHPDHHRPPRWTATTSRSRRCWRCRRSTSTWCARACAPPPAWWSRPARRARCITSRVLAGYGAEAVHPYLAMETLAALHKDLPGDLSAEKAIYNYVKAIGKGLSKIMSKMGVSTYMSLLRRAALRGHRPGQGAGRQVLPRHRQPGRRHRRVRGRRGGDPHAPRGLRRRPGAGRHARRRRRVRLARARRRAHVDARRDRQAAAQRARATSSRPTRNTRRSSTTSRSAT